MAETRRKFDQNSGGAVRLVRETGKPIAQIARELGINDCTLGNWVNADRFRREAGGAALNRVRAGGAGPVGPGRGRAADGAEVSSVRWPSG